MRNLLSNSYYSVNGFLCCSIALKLSIRSIQPAKDDVVAKIKLFFVPHCYCQRNSTSSCIITTVVMLNRLFCVLRDARSTFHYIIFTLSALCNHLIHAHFIPSKSFAYIHLILLFAYLISNNSRNVGRDMPTWKSVQRFYSMAQCSFSISY